MATKIPLTANLKLPPWFWGGDVPAFFDAAGLLASRDEASGDITVKTRERAERDSRPRLIRVTEVDGPAGRAGKPFMSQLEVEALSSLGTANILRSTPELERRLEHLLERAKGPISATALAAGFAAHQLQTLACDARDLDAMVIALLDDLRDIRMAKSDEPAFPNASAHFVTRADSLMRRMKLASVLLQIQRDDALSSGNLRDVLDANARGELIFAASIGHSDGVATLDAYLAPMLGALTPFVWVFPAVRAAGTVLYALGIQVSGTTPDAAEPLQVLPSRGSDHGAIAPELGSHSAEAAIAWWCKRLDKMFGVLSDPAVFTDANLVYVPSKHLHAQLSIEQLFRRTASIQRAHRDGDARRVLLFSTLDTLERVAGRTLTDMCSLSFAERTLAHVRKMMPVDAARLLLPAAERAVEALREMQAGFFLARQHQADVVQFVDMLGDEVGMPLAEATAEYLRVLRNATHGHGSTREEAKPRTDALLGHHDGSFPYDLALLGYLYLLDLLCHPANLRQVFWDGGAP